MKYFLLFIIFAITFIIFFTGSHWDIWQNIQRFQSKHIEEKQDKEQEKQDKAQQEQEKKDKEQQEQEKKDKEQQDKKEERQKIQAAYAILKAIASAEDHLDTIQGNDIVVWQKNINDDWEKVIVGFSEKDYEVFTSEKGDEKKFLRESSLLQFYYQLDNLALKELSNDLHLKVSTKLKERYEATLGNLTKIKQSFLQKENTDTVATNQEPEDGGTNVENTNIEKVEVVDSSIEEPKNINVISHDLFPFGENYFWKYRVLKFVDKSISQIFFKTIQQDLNWYWQDDSGNKKKIHIEDGYIKVGMSRMFPCSLDQKSWERGGYLIHFVGQQTISTEYGTFGSFVYYGTSETNSGDERKEYYAPGVGLIKEERFLSGKKIYEKVLVDCQNTKKENYNVEEYPFNANFYPIGEGCFWEYNVLKLIEEKISFIRLDMSREGNSWKLKDSTGYSPTIAISEDFVMQGLEKLIPPYTKKSENWRRGNFNVHISHFGEIVTTNAGTFKCLVVIIKDDKNPDYTQKEYYAHNVGEVKREIYTKKEKIYERSLHNYQNQYKK